MSTRCILIPLLFFIHFLPAGKADTPHTAIDITNWEYRIGDSPFQQGKPAWTLPDSDQSQWKTIDFPSNPQERNGAVFAWFRTQLPLSQLKDPVLYIFSVDLLVQVYLDDKKIYQFGDFSSDKKNRFIGWPWHQISLPDDYASHPLYFRVFSDYTDLGLWGEVKLIERAELIHFIISHGYSEIISAIFCLFIAFLAFAFALLKGKNKKVFFHLGMFSLVSALTNIGENQAVQLIYYDPLTRNYVAALGYFATPVFMGYLLFHWLGPGAGRYMCVIARCHAIYLSCALLLSLMGYINLASTYPVFDALFSCSLLIMLTGCLINLKKMNRPQHLVVASFGVYAILLILDMWVAHSLLPWARIDTGLGSLLFALSLVAIALYHYNQTQHALHHLNESLENKVRQRTASLQKSVSAEQQRARQLELIHHANLRLGDLISHLQKSSRLATAIEILNIELPPVFSPVPCFFYLVENEHSPASGPSDSQYNIQLQNLEGHRSDFARLKLELKQESQHPEFQAALSSFISRAIDLLSITLSSIKIREDLHRLSYEDALTGIRNRRYLDDSLEREIKQSKRYKRELSLLICDLDHFKQFNDDLGHEAGDIALIAVARVMRDFFKGTDIPCRYGGEEFVVLMPNVSLETAVRRAEALKNKVAELKIHYNHATLRQITLSIGVASWHDGKKDADKILQEADKALYRAKLAGRNCIECVTL